MQPIRGVLALAMLLLQLPALVEGAERACPKIGNFTTIVTEFPIPPVNGEPQEPLLLLTVILNQTEQSACDCNVHEATRRGRFRLKATVKRCFGGFGVIANEGVLHRVSTVCKKKGCPKVVESRNVTIKVIDCGHPGDIENGNVDFTSTTVGATANYSCDDGYQLQPFPGYFRFCSQSGNWSGDIPTCVAIIVIDCGHPGDIENGHVNFTSTTEGAIADYSCDDGYQLQPFPGYLRVCTQFGNWSGGAPTCVVDCGPPPEITNGTVIGPFTSVGSTASYFCDSGTKLVGNNTITCQDDGTWEDPPMCIEPADNCGAPPPIANGMVTYFRGFVLSTATYVCRSGYVPEGRSSILCYQRDGMWGRPPTCKPVQ